MELRHLRHFVAVAEELHFARAAYRLGMEQSPLSQSIRNLEADLRVKLFHRTTRGTWLTRAGTLFHAQAKRILTDIDTAIASLRAEDKEPAVIRLVLAENIAGEPFSRLLFELEHSGFGTAVDIHESNDVDAARLVRDGGADVILTLDSRPVDGLDQRRGWSEPLMLTVPIGHPFAERGQISLADLGTERLALPRPNVCPGYLAQIEEVFRRHEVGLANRMNVHHWNTAVSFAATGRALALCPTSMVHTSNAVAFVSIAEPDAELTTWLLYREGELSASVSLVLDVASHLAADAPLLADAAA